MKVWPRRKKPAMTREQAMACIPVKNDRVSETLTDEAFIRISYPLALPGWMNTLAARFRPNPGPPPTRTLELDAMGTQVWRLIDGRRSVEDIARRFARSHRISTNEAEAAVTAFVRELGKRGLIGLTAE